MRGSPPGGMFVWVLVLVVFVFVFVSIQLHRFPPSLMNPILTFFFGLWSINNLKHCYLATSACKPNDVCWKSGLSTTNSRQDWHWVVHWWGTTPNWSRFPSQSRYLEAHQKTHQTHLLPSTSRAQCTTQNDWFLEKWIIVRWVGIPIKTPTCLHHKLHHLIHFSHFTSGHMDFKPCNDSKSPLSSDCLHAGDRPWRGQPHW